jgi:hypothetical protein
MIRIIIDSTELKLPKGVVIAKDCTNCTSEVNKKFQIIMWLLKKQMVF